MTLTFAPLLFALAAADAVPKIELHDAWIREAPPGAAVLAGYVAIENRGTADAVVESAASDDFAEVEFHEMRMDGGVMQMRGIAALALPAGETVSLAPGGLHLMLHEPKRALAAGDEVVIELTLKGGGEPVTATFEVKRPD